MLNVGIVGASGYTGAELVRLLANHPDVEVKAVTSESFAGQKLNELYPALREAGDLILDKLENTSLGPDDLDLVFLGVPHGESMTMTPDIIKTGVKVIDLSGDFRFQDIGVYEKWYKKEHSAKELASKAVYGLPELFRNDIKAAKFVANPGCYVTATVLALYPLIKEGLIETETIVADAKSGISGAGRKATPITAFNRVSENVVPYKVMGLHQHTPEMENALSMATGKPVKLSFTPQLVPARRGILTSVYGRLVKKISINELEDLYKTTYANETFVSVRTGDETWPDLSAAVGSNSCIIKSTLDERTGMVMAVATIDNLIKGASGQAIQNMNLLCGLAEELGLPKYGMIP